MNLNKTTRVAQYMTAKIKETGKLLKTAFVSWNEKDPFRQSAAIAYYAIFSMPGLLILVITIAGYFFGKDTVHENILGQISVTMGTDTASQIKDILLKANEAKSSVLGSVIGIFVLLVGASGVFIELQKSLNAIWQVKTKPQRRFIPFIKSRLFSFGLILAISFLLMISLVVTSALVAISHWIQVGTSGIIVILFDILNFVFSLVVISILFGLMFKILPDAKIKWKHVWLGALLTGILFTIGKTALAYYFGTVQPGSVYGGAGSVILILLWVSYSSLILFFGAEFTAAYAAMYSGTVAPTELAVKDIEKTSTD